MGAPGSTVATPTLTVTRDSGAPVGDGLGRDRESQPLGHFAGLLGSGATEQHEELVAAVANRGVRVAGVLAQKPRDGNERAVACEVPVGVVDLLEAVDVEEDDRRLAPLNQLTVEVLGENRDVPAVEQAGERVE